METRGEQSTRKSELVKKIRFESAQVLNSLSSRAIGNRFATSNWLLLGCPPCVPFSYGTFRETLKG